MQVENFNILDINSCFIISIKIPYYLQRNKNIIWRIPRDILHELAHILLYRILQINQSIINKKALVSYTNLEIATLPRNRSFREGFAEYISLDLLIKYYDECNVIDKLSIKKYIKKKRSVYNNRKIMSKLFIASNDKICGIDYRFFKKVIKELGSDKFLDIARLPP